MFILISIQFKEIPITLTRFLVEVLIYNTYYWNKIIFDSLNYI